jgi:hypothetical protein
MSDFTLRAVFLRAGGQFGGSAVERLIVDATGGPECHVEAWIRTKPDDFFSAQPSTGVRIISRLVGAADRWYALDTGLTIPASALQWAVEECGQRYDTWDAFRSGFEGASDEEIRPLFCSMAFARLYNQCPGGHCLDYQLGGLGSGDPNPAKLAQLLRSYGATPCELPDVFPLPV